MRLDWNNEADGTFFDHKGVSLLIYAVSANNIKVTKYILEDISKNFGDNTQERARRVESRISKDGYLHFGIPGSCTALIGAMTLASPEMVQLLLANGADIYATGTQVLQLSIKPFQVVMC